MSAIGEGNEDGPVPIIQVLFALHPNFGAQELCGPIEVLSKALQKKSDPSMLRDTHFTLKIAYSSMSSCR